MKKELHKKLTDPCLSLHSCKPKLRCVSVRSVSAYACRMPRRTCWRQTVPFPRSAPQPSQVRLAAEVALQTTALFSHISSPRLLRTILGFSPRLEPSSLTMAEMHEHLSHCSSPALF